MTASISRRSKQDYMKVC